MNIPGSLTRLGFRHKAWPYPRTIHQVHQVIIVTAIALGLTLAGIIIGVKYQEQKTLSRQDVKYAAQQLTSSVSEMLFIAKNSENQTITKPYREIYLQRLATSVDKVRTNLSQHTTDRAVKPEAATLASVSNHLGKLLDAFARDSSDSVLSGDINELQALLKQTQQAEGSL